MNLPWPFVGNPEQLYKCGRALASAAENCQSICQTVGTAQRNTTYDGTWLGEAADAFVGRTRNNQLSLKQAHLLLNGGSRVLLQFAAELEILQQSYLLLEGALDELLPLRDSLQNQVQNFFTAPLGATGLPKLIDRLSEVESEIAKLDSEKSRLTAEATRARQQTAGALDELQRPANMPGNGGFWGAATKYMDTGLGLTWELTVGPVYNAEESLLTHPLSARSWGMMGAQLALVVVGGAAWKLTRMGVKAVLVMREARLAASLPSLVEEGLAGGGVAGRMELRPADYAVVPGKALAPAVAQVAEDLIAQAEIEKAGLTRIMRSIASANGGRLDGVENAVKQSASLERKIAEDAYAKGISAYDAGRRIKDISRYTIVFDDKAYSAGITRSLDQLCSQGFRLEGGTVKNFWQTGNRYMGVNARLEAPTGQTIEVQFHTEDSLQAGEMTHNLYEKYRTLNYAVPSQLRTAAKLYDRMVEINAAYLAKHPPGVGEIPAQPVFTQRPVAP